MFGFNGGEIRQNAEEPILVDRVLPSCLTALFSGGGVYGLR